MANSTNSHKPKATASNNNKSKRQQQKPKQKPNPSPTPIPSTPSKSGSAAPSWSVIRSIISCKHVQTQQQAPQHQTPPQKLKHKQKQHHIVESRESSNSSSTETKRSKKMKCSGSICDNTKVMQRPELMSSTGSSFHTTSSVSDMTHSSNSSASHNIPSSSSNSNNNNNNNVSCGSSGFKGMPFRRFTGCYECRLVVDPVVLGFTRDPSLRSTVCSCPDCGEVFMKAENLETHQAVRHAVSELGPEDTSRNIVEIIFQSSWQKKQTPVCKIDRILKVQNTPKTISHFESYRESIKSKANKTLKKHQRCIADGNELLRFHSTTLQCSLGLNGSTNLCDSISKCTVCSVIRNGFRLSERGILTTATSGRADDKIEEELLGVGGGRRMEVIRENPKKRAMLVCRVIAGRVKRENLEEFDSVSDGLETYSSLDELYVFDQKAILPCFVVIYGEES